MIPEWLKALPWKIIGIVAAVLLVLGYFQIRSCQQSAQRDAQSRVDRGQGDAFHWSASEATNTISGVNTNTMNAAEISRRKQRLAAARKLRWAKPANAKLTSGGDNPD